jgi:hypothetical protein
MRKIHRIVPYCDDASSVCQEPVCTGQLKKRYGPMPGYAGASGYAPGHLKHRYGAWGYVSSCAGSVRHLSVGKTE